MASNEWISEITRDCSFADVGGLWGTVNEKISVAALAGASSTTMIDIQPERNSLWEAFYKRCKEKGVICNKSIVANLDSPDFVARAGQYDVVHCSGIIYHCPNPLYSVSQLVKITKKYLILASTSIPITISNKDGSIKMEDNSALLVSAMTDTQKRVVNRYFSEVGADNILPIGQTQSVMGSDQGVIYTPWWYLFTANYIAGMLKACDAKVLKHALEWSGRTAYFLAEVTP